MSIRHRASIRTPCTDNTAHNSISELMAELYTHAFQSKTDRLPTKRDQETIRRVSAWLCENDCQSSFTFGSLQLH